MTDQAATAATRSRPHRATDTSGTTGSEARHPRPPARPSPRPNQRPLPRGVAAAPADAHAEHWGRVDEDGAVFVRTPDGPESEVKVGEWLAGDPADGIRFYERKYASLAVEIDLLEHRLGEGGSRPRRGHGADRQAP